MFDYFNFFVGGVVKRMNNFIVLVLYFFNKLVGEIVLFLFFDIFVLFLSIIFWVSKFLNGFLNEIYFKFDIILVKNFV